MHTNKKQIIATWREGNKPNTSEGWYSSFNGLLARLLLKKHITEAQYEEEIKKFD